MNQTLVDNDIYTDLAPVMTPDGKAVWASGGDLYFGAIFGRDSLEVAEDVVEFSPKLTKNYF